MSFMSEASTEDDNRAQIPHTVWWQEPTGYRAVTRFCYSWIEIGHSTKGSFSPASGFALVNLWWSHAGIEIPYPALFPLPISHPNPIKTRNPAPTSNWNSRFPPIYSAQIPNITAKKSQIPHPAKPIGDPHWVNLWTVKICCHTTYLGPIWDTCFSSPQKRNWPGPLSGPTVTSTRRGCKQQTNYRHVNLLKEQQ